jgi:hypothetical protein
MCGMGEPSEAAGALAQKLIDRVWVLNEEIGISRTTNVIREEDIEALVEAAITEGVTTLLRASSQKRNAGV